MVLDRLYLNHLNLQPSFCLNFVWLHILMNWCWEWTGALNLLFHWNIIWEELCSHRIIVECQSLSKVLKFHWWLNLIEFCTTWRKKPPLSERPCRTTEDKFENGLSWRSRVNNAAFRVVLSLCVSVSCGGQMPPGPFCYFTSNSDVLRSSCSLSSLHHLRH